MKTWEEVRKGFQFSEKEEMKIQKNIKKIFYKIDRKKYKLAKKEEKQNSGTITIKV